MTGVALLPRCNGSAPDAAVSRALAVLPWRSAAPRFPSSIILEAGFPIFHRYPSGCFWSLPDSASWTRRSGSAYWRRGCVLVKPSLRGRKTLPAWQRGGERDFLPFRMEGRALKGRKLGEERIDKQRQLAITISARGPVIRRKSGRHRDGIDPVACRNQIRIVLRGQGRRQIVGLQRHFVIDVDQTEAAVIDKVANGFVGLAANDDHGVDLALL